MRSQPSLLDCFFRRLEKAPSSLLMLDYDGTLAPFKREITQARPYPGVVDLLNRIMKTGRCRLIIVTGRAVKDLRPLIGLDRLPEVWGSHGRERLGQEGTYLLREIDPEARQKLRETRGWAMEYGLEDWIEEKPGCLAFHFRGRNPVQVARVRSALQKHWDSSLRNSNIEMHTFDGGIEFRVEGVSKATAVEIVLGEVEEDVPVAYLGDDLTDEDAFRALGDRGLGVLVRDTPRPTEAAVHLSPPGELLEFLTRWANALKGQP